MQKVTFQMDRDMLIDILCAMGFCKDVLIRLPEHKLELIYRAHT